MDAGDESKPIAPDSYPLPMRPPKPSTSGECLGPCCKGGFPADQMLAYSLMCHHAAPPPHQQHRPWFIPAQAVPPPPARPDWQGGGGALAPPHPSALSVQLPPDAPEDAKLNSASLVELQQLWDDWHLLAASTLPKEQITGELKRLASRTAGAVGPASQGAVARQQMQELLYYASDVMCDKGQGQGAEFLARLAENMAAAAGLRSGALVTNVVSGSRQTMSGALVSKPDIRLKAAADVRAKTEAHALARSKAWLQKNGGGWLGMAVAAVGALAGYELLRRGIGRVGRRGCLEAGRSEHGGASSSGSGTGGAWAARRAEAAERRRVQCEGANVRAREYLTELRSNRFNPLWHRDPPPDTCAMPPDNLPWRPAAEDPTW